MAKLLEWWDATSAIGEGGGLEKRVRELGNRAPRAVPPGRQAGVFAAIDLGTNNCRLLVVRPDGEGYRVTDSFSRIVRLGEGLAANGALSEAAMRRTINALKVCCAKMSRGRVSRARSVATAACRRAANCEAFLEDVRAQTGLDLEIISASEEAHLTLAGCAALLDYDYRHALLFDIGGGSTELTWLALDGLERHRVAGLTSLPFGVVTLAERFGGRVVAAEDYRAMVAYVESAVRPFGERYDMAAQADGVHLLGTSSTVATLAAVQLELPKYDRARLDGAWLTLEDVYEVTARLLAMDYRTRLEHPCIRRGRADLVIAGCAVLEGIVRVCPAARLRVAGRGLREGMLLSMMREAGAKAAFAASA